MALEIRLKPAARKDLADIHDWTWFRFGKPQADHHVAEIAAKFRLIAENPGFAISADPVRPGC